MYNDLVLTVPTYNSLEYLKIFIESWERYASNYRLLVTVDGSTDGTIGYLSSFISDSSKNHNLYVDVFDRNKGQASAYNNGFVWAREKFLSKYVCVLNDDMVFGPCWDLDLQSQLHTLDVKTYLILNLASPIQPGYSAVSYYGAGVTPDIFDMTKWHSFCLDSVTLNKRVYEESCGPGLPFIISVSSYEKNRFDLSYTGGGCLDTDLRFQLYLDGFKYLLLNKNLLFHFIGGSTDKVKKLSQWVEHGDTFFKKWNVGIGLAMDYIKGSTSPDKLEIARLKKSANLVE